MSQSQLVYTPLQVSEILQINKNTVYELIEKGEIVAKKFGRVYRIPKSSISFAFSGMDQDIYDAQQIDLKNQDKVNRMLDEARGESKS